MSGVLYQIEVCRYGEDQEGKAWGFNDSQKRNELYRKTKERFAEKEYTNKNDGIGKDIVQLSSFIAYTGGAIGAASIIPYEWYEESVYEEMIEYIEKEYQNLIISKKEGD